MFFFSFFSIFPIFLCFCHLVFVPFCAIMYVRVLYTYFFVRLFFPLFFCAVRGISRAVFCCFCCFLSGFVLFCFLYKLKKRFIYLFFQDVDVAFFAVSWFQTLFLYTSRMSSDTLLWLWDVWITERSYKVRTQWRLCAYV